MSRAPIRAASAGSASYDMASGILLGVHQVTLGLTVDLQLQGAR